MHFYGTSILSYRRSGGHAAGGGSSGGCRCGGEGCDRRCNKDRSGGGSNGDSALSDANTGAGAGVVDKARAGGCV